MKPAAPRGIAVPRPRLAWMLAAMIPALVVAAASPLAGVAALAIDAVLFALAWAEARAVRRSLPSAERIHDPRLVVGAPNEIVVRLHNPSARPLRVSVRDEVPAGWRAEPEALEVELRPYSRRDVRYRTWSPARGAHAFGDLHLRVEGRARLVAVSADVPASETVRVYPNLVAPKRFDLAVRLGNLAHLGFRATRRDGGGGDFEKLREYVAGDDFGDIDWKATAKRQRPLVRVRQQERSQPVVVCIDAGRMMAARLGELSKLDHAIGAALLAAYAALRRGDRVGLAVFSDDVTTFLAPRAGPEQYRRILEAVHDVEATLTFVDFRRLVQVLRARLPKRALVIVLTDLLDEEHARPFAEHAGLLGARHLPVCVTMRDEVVETLASRTPRTTDEAYDRVAATDLVAEREALRSRLRKEGVSLVEAPPGELAVATVNRYLELKQRGAL